MVRRAWRCGCAACRVLSSLNHVPQCQRRIPAHLIYNSIDSAAGFKVMQEKCTSRCSKKNKITEDTGATWCIRGLTYLSCVHQPQTHEQKRMHTSALICPAQILDQGACLKNQRSNRKAITPATHQQRADSNTITFRLQRPAADK